MNVLLLDQGGVFVDFSLRCMAAGHHVRLCIAREDNGQPSPVGDGLVEKIPREEWSKSMAWADLVLTSDNNRWLRELDIYRRKGFPVFAPSYDSAQLELNRGLGQRLFEKNGIKTIPSEVFSDYAKAEKYVQSEMQRFVSKPDGDKATKDLSYVSQSPRDMLFMLGQWKQKLKTSNKFILQEFVPGSEFAVNGWLGRKGFSRFIEESFEHKKFMNDDKGPNTGEMGTVLKYVENSSLAKEVLLPLEGDLIKLGHTGSVDVSVIVNEAGEPMPMEFTMRLGWPAFFIVQPLHPDPCAWMAELLDGDDTFQPSMDVAVGVVMTTTLASVSGSNAKEKRSDLCGVPLYDLNDENPYRHYLSPVEVQSGVAPNECEGEIEDERMMVSAGGYLCVATGCGDTVREAQAEAYKAADSIEIPHSVMMRTDIGDRCKKAIPDLQAHGFAQDWEW